jgi:catechol 2,3-dioxygenase-like lactoylglutathione lyase family enzyme
MRTVTLFLMSTLVMTADAPRRPHITGVAHIALYAHDIGKARWYYKDFLGFAEPFSLQKADGSLAVAFIKINDRQYIELSPEVESGTDRLNHIAIETDDAEAMRVYLKARGVSVPDTVSRGRTGNSNFTVKDPDGHVVEIVQYEPGSWSSRENGQSMPAGRVSATMTHVGILVGALEPAMTFYRGILGFQEIWRGSRDDKQLNWVNMKAPDGDTYIEFMLYDRLPAPDARGSAHHLCLQVADVASAKARLENEPAARDYSRAMEIRVGINRKRQLNLFDPDGTRSELMEPGTVDGVPAKSSTAPPPRFDFQ